MIPALQTILPMRVPVRSVLTTISGLRHWASFQGYDEDAILWFIQGGYLLAFNIALDLDSAAEWRILPDSARWLQDNFESQNPPPRFENWPAELLKSISGHLTSTQARLILNCGATHIANLLDAGLLKQPIIQSFRTRGHAAVITRDSFIGFLKSRLEGA